MARVGEYKPPMRTVTFYLMRDDVQRPEDAFREKVDRQSVRTGVLGDSERSYALYVENRQEHETGWARDVAGALELDGIGATTSSASAALVFQVEDETDEAVRVMATTWGPAGRHFIDLNKVDDRYGMTTAMNLIDPNAVRSKDSRSFDDSVKQKRTQSSRLTSFDEFEYDPMTEILDHVTGKVVARHDGFAKTVSGSYYLQIRGRMEPGQIFDKARRSLGHFHRRDYLAKFPWVKNKRSVTNPDEVEELDEMVADQLRTGASTNFHLAAPTIVDWDKIAGFVHKGLRRPSITHDLDLRDYLERVNASQVTPESLRNDDVRVFYSDGRPEERWPIYRSLVAEVDHDGEKHILSAGRWFRLDDDWVNDIETKLGGIPDNGMLPTADTYDQLEEDYNKKAAKHVGGVVMDQVRLRPSNASSDVELCDILTEDLKFIHVKKRESSATLSHLYMQGSVSAQTVTGDDHYRTKAEEEIRGIQPDFGALGLWDTFRPGDMEVVYAVMAEDRFKGKEKLPFFSKVSLWQTSHLLKRLGFGVSYANILRPDKP